MTKSKSLDLDDLLSTDPDLQVITNGEAAILQKLEAMQDTLDELSEKVSNLNLIDNPGFNVYD